MIIPDINLLVYAYNRDAAHHGRAKRWLEDLLNGTTSVAFAWVVVYGFIRIMTHPRVMEFPLRPSEAVGHVRSWLEMPTASIIEPGRRHLAILGDLLDRIGSAGNLTTDAVIAALGIEYQAEVHSNDADFRRFSGLRWVDPMG